MCINNEFRRSLQDVRVRRGADVTSDHHLVITRVKLKLKKNPSVITRRQRYTVSLLRDNEKREEYQNRLYNKFQVLQELIEEDDIPMEHQWRNVKEILNSTCKEVVGFRKHQHKEWISAKTLKKIESRRIKKAIVNNSRTRAEKARVQKEYADGNKEVKTDKKNYINSLAKEAEEAAYSGNMKQLYDTTRKLSGKYGRPERPVKDKNGKTIIGKEGQFSRWAEHFAKMLNGPTPSNPSEIQPADLDLPINCKKPSRNEIRKAIMKLKNGKAAGVDNIPSETLKPI